MNWLLPPKSLMDKQIESWMEKKNVPGLAACIVKGDKVVWSKGYGMANHHRHRHNATAR